MLDRALGFEYLNELTDTAKRRVDKMYRCEQSLCLPPEETLRGLPGSHPRIVAEILLIEPEILIFIITISERCNTF